MSEDAIRQAVSDGLVDGAKRLSQDKDFCERFWETGFKHLKTHSTNHASQWVGKRILTAFIAAAVTAGIIWLVKTGQIK